ncbi:hypothetical protein [Poriferisphaera sp. WC338]|uniref:hypothetical protein n=1 Tax=Poriferisphaera sp. WC338 TaxID=3425129 RepID=UPI003D81B8FC
MNFAQLPGASFPPTPHRASSNISQLPSALGQMHSSQPISAISVSNLASSRILHAYQSPNSEGILHQ